MLTETQNHRKLLSEAQADIATLKAKLLLK